MSQPEQPKPTAPRSLLIIACSMFWVMAIPMSTLNVAWTYMQVTFDKPLDALGILLLGNTFGSLISSFFSGRVIARLGMGRYLISGGVLLALGLVGYILAPSWIALIGAAFITALGFSTFNAGLNNFVSSRYSTGQFNWLHAFYGLGQATGPALAQTTIETLGLSWHVSYAVALVPALVILGILVATRGQWVMPGLSATSERGAQGKRVSLWESLRVPAVLLGMSLFFLSSGFIASVGQLSNTLFTARGVLQAGYWVSAYWASFTVGRIVMGFIAHRLQNTFILRAALAGAVVGALLIWQNASTVINLIGLMVIGFSCAPFYPTLIAETRRRVEARYRLNALGFQMAAAGLGQSLLPGAIAWVAARTSLDWIGALILIATGLAFVLHEVATQRRESVAVEA
jgi:fucose permease